MSAHQRIPALITRAGTTSALTATALTGTVLVPVLTPQAHAMAPAVTAVQVAASKEGAPYQWGGNGPYNFDCSGLTRYAYKKAGKKLPRTAAAQYNTTRRVPASSRKPGDLVFFHSGGYVYHVGIYAGKGRIWHAPKPGRGVSLEKIWTSNVSYGRVR